MNPAPQLPSAPDIPLHDIKPLVEVNDHTFVMFALLVGVGALLLLGVLYLLWRFWRHRRRANVRRETFARLESVDFSDSKKAAYAITRDGLLFAGDSPRCSEAYEALVARLAPYKYKKRVDAIDEETVSYYEIYVGMIDV
jgi:hypothetical protein